VQAWKDRERAAEEMYFSKEEAATLAKLAKKMQAQTSVRAAGDHGRASHFMGFGALSFLSTVSD
jgi:hypothetical protein